KNAVLEYDGIAWKKIVVTGTTYVRGLAIEPGTGTMSAGAVDELGYFKAEPSGKKQFVSLLAQLPPDARDFRDIRRVYATNQGVFFVADQQVMRWRDGAFKVWKLPNPSRLQSDWAGDQLFVQQPEVGLLRLQDDAFIPVSADALFQRGVVTFLAAAADASLIIGTHEEGLFTLRDGAVAPFATDTDAFLKEKKIRRGLRLRDGSLALATDSSGLVVLDTQGRLRSRVDATSELQNDIVLDLFQDGEGVLWLCLNSGITRVEVASPLSIFDAANGLKRITVRDMLRHAGILYFATGDGLYRLLPADPANGQPARCERIKGTEGEWWSLSSHDSGLLAAGVEGVVQLGNEGEPRKVTQRLFAMSLRQSRTEPQRVLIGTRDGLRSIRREDNGEWRDEGMVAGTSGGEIRTIIEDARGEVWLATPIQGIFRVTFADAPAGSRGTPTVTRHYETDGLPQGQHWTRVIERKGGEALFATQVGLYRFDNETKRFQSVADFGARFGDGSYMPGSVAQDAAGDLCRFPKLGAI
ncbi:MAG: hypothetical protein LC642_01725, partial [Verrucomicrobiaceae bacterium]|nr:hypothetical protein [Verrucomicrobiaceae bacterium]